MDRHGFARYESFTIQKPYIILRNLSLLQIRHSGLIPEHRDTNTFFDIELGKRPTNRLFDCLQFLRSPVLRLRIREVPMNRIYF